MSYLSESFCSRDYWRYAIFSAVGLKTLFVVLGFVLAGLEIFEIFGLLPEKVQNLYGLASVIIICSLFTIYIRRPVNKIECKIQGKDLSVEVFIGNIFELNGEIIISSNTTFDTNTSNGLISRQSVQGQFAEIYFPGRISDLDDQLEKSLSRSPWPSVFNDARIGKKNRIPHRHCREGVCRRKKLLLLGDGRNK